MSHYDPKAACKIFYESKKMELSIDLKNFKCDEVIKVIDQLSVAISDAHPEDNPYGLFYQPLTDEEITLVIENDAMKHQESLACLVEELYISCNHPMHYRIETDAETPLEEKLTKEIRQHLTAKEEGGYAPDYRPRSTWLWVINKDIDSEQTHLSDYLNVSGTTIAE